MKSNEIHYVCYHGTDARFVRMSEAERLAYRKRCDRAIEYMWPFYRQIWDEKANILSLFKRIPNQELASAVSFACSMHQSYLNGSGRYQYGDLYLTSYLPKAVDYALDAFVGGEYARIAYRLYQGAVELKFDGWNPDEDFCETIGMICKHADETREPVIFKFENLDLDFLARDDGREIDFNNEYWPSINQMARYAKPVRLDLTKAVFLPSHFKMAEIEEMVKKIESQ